MAWTEVEHAALAHLPEAPTAEMLTLVPTFLEDHRVRRRHVERLVIHLRLLHVPFQRQAGGDRMIRQQGREMTRRAVAAIRGKDAAGQRELPDAVRLAQRRRQRSVTARHFAVGVLVGVFELGRGALGGGNLRECIVLGPFLHEPHERLCPMRRVQRDESQFSLTHASHQALHVFVRDQMVPLMTPPDDHIGVVECCFVEALFRRGERDALHRETRLRREVRRDGFAEEFFAVGALLFRLLLVPDEHADRARSGGVKRGQWSQQ